MFVEGAGETVHPAGNFTYKFHMVLPPFLPSSVDGAYGHICYRCHATIDLPWKFDKECEVPFAIARTFDLNMEPAVKVCIRLTLFVLYEINAKLYLTKSQSHLLNLTYKKHLLTF